jgi:hypothetical protein
VVWEQLRSDHFSQTEQATHEKKSTYRSAFLNPRVLISFAFCAIGVLLSLLAFAFYPGGNALAAPRPQQDQLALPAVQSTQAATITVQSTADGAANPANCPGAGCRLRDAIAAAVDGDSNRHCDSDGYPNSHGYGDANSDRHGYPDSCADSGCDA